MTTLIRANVGQTQARVYYGDWIIDCQICRYARTLQRDEQVLDCPECGWEAEIIWPTEEMMDGIRRLLMMRRYPRNRNWFPGETLPDLIRENALYGGLPELPEADPNTVLLQAFDERITTDLLPSLAGSSRKAIG